MSLKLVVLDLALLSVYLTTLFIGLSELSEAPLSSSTVLRCTQTLL